MVHGERLYALLACPNKLCSQRQQISQQRSIGIRVVKAKGEAALTSEMPGQPRGARSRGRSGQPGGRRAEPEESLLAIELNEIEWRERTAERISKSQASPEGSGAGGSLPPPPHRPCAPPSRVRTP